MENVHRAFNINLPGPSYNLNRRARFGPPRFSCDMASSSEINLGFLFNSFRHIAHSGANVSLSDRSY